MNVHILDVGAELKRELGQSMPSFRVTRTPALRAPTNTAYPTKPLAPVIRIKGEDDIMDNVISPELASKTVVKVRYGLA